jgi:hypothetical protein
MTSIGLRYSGTALEGIFCKLASSAKGWGCGENTSACQKAAQIKLVFVTI